MAISPEPLSDKWGVQYFLIWVTHLMQIVVLECGSNTQYTLAGANVGTPGSTHTHTHTGTHTRTSSVQGAESVNCHYLVSD